MTDFLDWLAAIVNSSALNAFLAWPGPKESMNLACGGLLVRLLELSGNVAALVLLPNLGKIPCWP
jgi:hypothetical protein